MKTVTLLRFIHRNTLFLLLLLMAPAVGLAQDVQLGEVSFLGLQRDFAGIELSYRKADITGSGTGQKALVIYLHGGSSCGSDNVSQMREPGIDSIAGYLHRHQVDAVMLVPQCPDRSRGWGGMAQNIKALLDFTVRTEDIDTMRIYVLGGSMGGTGTWKMLSTFPGYFAAAMPCAANPKGMSVQNAATTPVYNVMGLDDKIMNGQVRQIAEDFIAQMRALGGEAEYETVPGWTHETTCIQSYSDHRLGWLFAHSRSLPNGIEPAGAQATECDGQWYTLQGVRVECPLLPGIYVRNGKKTLVNP